MTESNDRKTHFAGTYFDLDTVLRLARLLKIAAWIVGGIYAYQFIVTITVFSLQMARGLLYFGGPTDFLQQVGWIIQSPLAGLIFFVALQAIANGLLILLDIEDNTRRAARKDA